MATLLTIRYLNRNDFHLDLENINLTKQREIYLPPTMTLWSQRKPTFLLSKLILKDPINCPLFWEAFPDSLTTFTDFMALESVSTSALSPQSQRHSSEHCICPILTPSIQYRKFKLWKKKKRMNGHLYWYLCTQQSNGLKSRPIPHLLSGTFGNSVYRIMLNFHPSSNTAHHCEQSKESDTLILIILFHLPPAKVQEACVPGWKGLTICWRNNSCKEISQLVRELSLLSWARLVRQLFFVCLFVLSNWPGWSARNLHTKKVYSLNSA